MASKVRVHEDITFEAVSESGHDLARLRLWRIVRRCAIDCRQADHRGSGASAHPDTDASARADPDARAHANPIADANTGSDTYSGARADTHADADTRRQRSDAPVDLHRQ
jgi:hypothetical protein